jgi:hypothetical protein
MEQPDGDQVAAFMTEDVTCAGQTQELCGDDRFVAVSIRGASGAGAPTYLVEVGLLAPAA